MLSVDWEGDTLRESNLQAMRRFNRRYPDFPVIHFLNAAYYTKNWELSELEITAKIKSVIKPIDEIGIHIHPWENFVRASGVEFREGPSFWGDALSIGRNGELGDDVPLNIYSKEEISAQIAYSKKVLKAQGFKTPTSFRGGGWMSGPKVWEALRQERILIDSSAVPTSLVENLYPDTLLAQKNRELWQGVTPQLGPYRMDQKMLQFPNNVGLADYVNEHQFFQQYLDLYQDALAKGQREIYLHFGWHQESAVEYFEHNPKGGMKLVRSNFLERVERGIEMLKQHAKKKHIQIQPRGFNKFPKSMILTKGKACAVISKGLFLPTKP